MQKTIRLAALAAAFAAAGAQAQVYVEGSYVPTKISGDHGLSSNPKPSVFTGIIGYDLHPNLAVEGVVGLGLEKDRVTETVNGVSVHLDTKIKSSYGFYLKPRYQVTDALEVFARIGYLRSKLQITATAGAFSASESWTDGSTALGLGANYAFDKNIYLTAGYNQFYKQDGVTIKGLNLGIGYKF